MKLTEALQNIEYSSSWGIWAELQDGKLSEDSECRYGQHIFENGGLLDDWVYVCNGEYPSDWAVEFGYTGEDSDQDWDMDELLYELNAQLD